MGPYSASKFAVVAISESLYHEMAMLGGAIGVSVLCPGWMNTNIHSSERNRPTSLAGAGSGVLDSRGGNAQAAPRRRHAPGRGREPGGAAVVTGRFYVLTHPDMTPAVANRMKAIVEGANPALQMTG